MLLAPADRYGQVFDLGDELTVGRANGCGVSLPEDTFVSTLHARVFRRDGRLYVEDLGSTNGTFINERPVNGTVPFHAGDRLQVGKTVLELAP
jgi:pSer/pThr/pTyr-binding forkhead associated (FHA) protein